MPHMYLVPLRIEFYLQLVYFCLDVEELYSLHATIDQSRDAVEKPQTEYIFVQEEEHRRAWNRKQLLPQPATALCLRTKERWSDVHRIAFPLKPHPRLPIGIFVMLTDVVRKR